jgi:hypothetical protein
MRPALSELLRQYDPAMPLEEASTIPSSWYLDPRIEALEKNTTFSRTWQMAGRVDQVRNPGDYVTCEIAGEPILVVRGDDGALRGFFKGAWADSDAKRRVFKVLYEDQAIVDAVRPELLPFDLSAELHVKSDSNAIAYRRRRNELVEAGWGVDDNTIVGEGGARIEARVIPSPTRREVPELASAWNFKEARSREMRLGLVDPDGRKLRKEYRLVHEDPAPESDTPKTESEKEVKA